MVSRSERVEVPGQKSRSARRSGPFIKGEISAADRAGLSPILHDLWHHDGLRRKWSSAEELLEPVHGGVA